MRLIDADALFAEFENVGWYNNTDRDEIAERLVLQAPTIDAVSVVRCSDCVYCNVQNTKYLYAICQKHGIEFKPFEDDTRTHGCTWGERKGE